MPRQSHAGQWAAQFAVASELCKRDYQVALTLGNHPSVDLMVRSPNGVSFEIDVKGLRSKNYFLLKPKPARPRLFYVLAYVPSDSVNRFFVLSQADANREVEEDIERARIRQKAKGRTGEEAGVMPGIRFKDAERYEDRWKEVLPA